MAFMIGLDSLMHKLLLRIVWGFRWCLWITEPSRSQERAPELFSGYLEFLPVVRSGRVPLDADFRHEPVATSHDGLQVLRLGGIVVKGHADFADRGIDSLLDVDEDVLS